MTFKENIDKNEYELFVENHATKSHFMQSYFFGETNRYKGFIPFICGLYDKKALVGSALILKKPLPFGLCYFYVPRGYVLDYTNLDVLKEMTKGVKKMAKENKAIFVTIDPDVELEEIDSDAKPIKDLNHKLVDEMIKMGYKHKGYNYNFENREPRYTFRLDLNPSEDELHSNMHSTIRNVLNRGNQFGVHIFLGNFNDLDKFYFVMDQTGERQNIIPFKHEYYKLFYEVFHNKNMCDLYVAEVDIDNLKGIYHKRIKDLEDKIINLEKNKQDKGLNDLNDQLNKAKKEAEEIKNMPNNVVTLASYMTVKYGSRVWIVHGGNANYLRDLNANYLIYDKMIMDVKEHGYKSLDFFGTTGKDSKDNPIHGIHLFKKRLGGKYTEFIGEFDLIINKPWYFIYNTILPTYHKLGHWLKKKRK